jgi:hypothetical protein
LRAKGLVRNPKGLEKNIPYKKYTNVNPNGKVVSSKITRFCNISNTTGKSRNVSFRINPVKYQEKMFTSPSYSSSWNRGKNKLQYGNKNEVRNFSSSFSLKEKNDGGYGLIRGYKSDMYSGKSTFSYDKSRKIQKRIISLISRKNRKSRSFVAKPRKNRKTSAFVAKPRENRKSLESVAKLRKNRKSLESVAKPRKNRKTSAFVAKPRKNRTIRKSRLLLGKHRKF